MKILKVFKFATPFLYIFIMSESFAQIKTTYQYDRRGNRTGSIMVAQTNEVLSNKITVQNLQKSSITYSFTEVSQAGVQYVIQMPPYVSRTVLSSYQSSITQALPNPNERQYQLSVSHKYPQGCVVAAYINITPPFCPSSLNLIVSPDHSVFNNEAKSFQAYQTISSKSEVNKGGYAEYEAVQFVELLPGFKSDEGSRFKVEVKGCDN